MQHDLNKTWAGVHALAIALFAAVILFPNFDLTRAEVGYRLLIVLLLAGAGAVAGVKAAPTNLSGLKQRRSPERYSS
jgi:hypothetical protein